MAVKYKNARLLALGMNALGILAGVCLFVMSVTFVSYPNFVEEYISIHKVKGFCASAIGLSLVLTVASAVNLVAVLKEDVRMMKIAIGVVVVVFLANIVCIIVAVRMKFQAQEDVNDQIYDIMRKYGQDEFPENTDLWDFFQKRMKCCGSDGAGDWAFTPFVENGNSENLIPRSCCKSYASLTPFEPACQRMTDKSLYYTLGCKDAVNRLSWAFSGSIAGVLAFAAICEVVGALATWMLIKELSRDNEAYEFSPPPSTAPKRNAYSGGTLRSQQGGGTLSSHKQYQQEQPMSETGSVVQSDQGSKTGSVNLNPPPPIRMHPPPAPHSVGASNRPSGASSVSPIQMEYRPNLPPPPPPPSSNVNVASNNRMVEDQDDENLDFDV